MTAQARRSTDERDRLEAQLHRQLANEAFDKFTDQVGARYLGGRRLRRTSRTLIGSPTTSYANAHVAHVEEAPGNLRVTYAYFHAAVDHLGGILKRYYLLINQGGLVSATPAIQGNWKGPFRRPLVR